MSALGVEAATCVKTVEATPPQGRATLSEVPACSRVSATVAGTALSHVCSTVALTASNAPAPRAVTLPGSDTITVGISTVTATAPVTASESSTWFGCMGWGVSGSGVAAPVSSTAGPRHSSHWAATSEAASLAAATASSLDTTSPP